MNKLSLLILPLLLGHNISMAAISADLRLAVTLVPAACDITLAGGEFNFGTISSGTLSAARESTKTFASTKNLSIVCTGPSLIGIRAIDNRTGTSIRSGDVYYGIGRDSKGGNIGYYLIGIGAVPTLDGVAAFKSKSDDGGVTWGTLNGTALSHSPGAVLSWNKIADNADPDLVTEVVQPLGVEMHIAPTNTLDISNEITIDGSTTIELVYL
ncbi:DUF1120 domain-containing protein [Pseudomonas sp. NPDC098747]|uniref:DUF1120 domain-containing protein n=1 Tax=Pseudomonas sp. NPDC098747 TaxID=3364487 RepID=UPI00383A5FB4